MIAREPEKYAQYADGVPGGPENPLGARALYLFRDGRDTYYRIHGTTNPETIGSSVSNGCIRLRNEDVMALYENVAIGTHVTVV
jgi:lipoprotein-anchoring transpeptidase ErfK/SrfK